MIPFKGNYTDWLQAKSNRIDQEGKSLRSKEKNLKRELEWIQASKRTKQTLNKVIKTSFPLPFHFHKQKRDLILQI